MSATVEDIALTLHVGLGVKGIVHLLDCFVSAQTVYSSSVDEIRAKSNLW